MADDKNDVSPKNRRIVVFNQPKWEQEKRALSQLVETLDHAPEVGDYRVFVGYYVSQPGGRSLEADAVLITRYGVTIVELKDFFGLTEMSSVDHSRIYRTVNGVIRRESNPSFGVRDRCRAMVGVVKDNRLPPWPVSGLLLFTHAKGELRIGETSTVTSLASGELGVGGITDVPRLLQLIAGPGKPARLLDDDDIVRVSDVLSRGVKHIKDRFPFQVGDYVVEAPISPFEEIAAGGTVDYRLYRGYEQYTKTPVLIKELSAEDSRYFSEPEGSSNSLMHAVKALRAMSEDHPNIVRLLTAHVSDNYETVYHIYKLEEATPLYYWLEAPIGQRINLLAQTAEALDFVHANGMLHRSVSPFNILVTGGGEKAKLFNFDFARVDGVPTRLYEAQKQPMARYVAEELRTARKREDIAWQCDSFSFGYTVFEILSGGQAPFEDPDKHQVQRDLRDYTDVSDELVAQVDRALSVRPAERPPLAEFAAALQQEERRHAQPQ